MRRRAAKVYLYVVPRSMPMAGACLAILCLSTSHRTTVIGARPESFQKNRLASFASAIAWSSVSFLQWRAGGALAAPLQALETTHGTCATLIIRRHTLTCKRLAQVKATSHCGRNSMSRSETYTSPADLAEIPEPDATNASPTGRVVMIHSPKTDLLDSRYLPGQHSHSKADQVS